MTFKNRSLKILHILSSSHLSSGPWQIAYNTDLANVCTFCWPQVVYFIRICLVLCPWESLDCWAQKPWNADDIHLTSSSIIPTNIHYPWSRLVPVWSRGRSGKREWGLLLRIGFVGLNTTNCYAWESGVGYVNPEIQKSWNPHDIYFIYVVMPEGVPIR